ncbi:MAG: CvpA family protein [Ruminococcaceae bacterium]|nr:CvpA family protein [Oscillospiraceae bacterium]
MGASVGLGLGGIFLIIAAWGFIRGMFKGTFRSLSDVVFVILNVIASSIISKGIAKAVLSPQKLYEMLISANEKLNNETVAGWISAIEPYFKDGEFLAEADFSYLLALPVVILAPIIFMVVFLTIGLIFKIVKFILNRFLIPKTSNLGLKVIGGALGAVRNVLAVAVFIVPIIGYATYSVNVIGMVQEADETIEIADRAELDSMVNTGAVGVINNCGGHMLFKSLSSVQVDDVKVSLTDETGKIVNVYKKAKPLIGVDMASLTSAETAKIDEVIDEIEKSEYLTALVTSVVSQTTTELYEKNQLMGYELPYYGKTFDPVVKCVLKFMSTMDSEGLITDLRTYSSVVKSMVQCGLFRELNDENGDLYIVLENDEFYSGILIPLYKNERTRPIVPTVADALQSYLFEVYEEVNGVPYHGGAIDKVDQSKINETTLHEEGNRIATAIKEIRAFSYTIEGLEYVDDMVMQGDFAALGRGLNQIRDSIFFGHSYHFLLDSILHSDTCANLGIFDSNFIENATRPDADMQNLLLSRQHLATLTIHMWDGDKKGQEEALKVLIEEVMADDTDALKELASPENLERYGVVGEKGATISAITVSIVDTIHTHEYEDLNGDGSVEDEKHAEAEKTAHILTVINSAHDDSSGAENVFDNGDGESKTGETAEQLVDNMLESTIATEMIQSATETEGNDPYNVQDSLTDADRASLQEVLDSRYSTAETEKDKQSVANIANIFGITLVP